MNWKSIRFSIYTILFFCGLLVCTVFLFQLDIMLGVFGIIALIVFAPMLAKRAVSEASGKIDKLVAKLITPLVCAVAFVFLMLTLFLWD